MDKGGKLMHYKLMYEEYGTLHIVWPYKKEPLQILLRHLFALHNNYKGSTENLEIIFFGEGKDKP